MHLVFSSGVHCTGKAPVINKYSTCQKASREGFWNLYNWVLCIRVFTSKHHFIRPFVSSFLLSYSRASTLHSKVCRQHLGLGTSKSQMKRERILEKSSLKLAPRPSGLLSCLFALRSLSHFLLLCFVLHGADPYKLHPQTLLPSVLQLNLANKSHWKIREREKPRDFSLLFSAWDGVFGGSWVLSAVVALTGQSLMLDLPSPEHWWHHLLSLFA